MKDLDAIGASQFIETMNGSQNTRYNVLRLIRPAFAKAVRDKKLRENPFELLDKSERPKKSKSKIVCFEVAHERRLITFVRAQPNLIMRAIVLLAFDIGCEPQEFLGLQGRDINADAIDKDGKPAPTVHFRRVVNEVRGQVLVETEMKAESRSRKVPICQTSLAALSALMGPSRGPEAHVLSATGTPWGYDAFYKAWKKLLKDAEVPHYQPLSMRHTAASNRLSEGVPLPVVSAMLGHSRPSTTLDHYAHAMPNDMARLPVLSEARFERHRTAADAPRPSPPQSTPVG